MGVIEARTQNHGAPLLVVDRVSVQYRVNSSQRLSKDAAQEAGLKRNRSNRSVSVDALRDVSLIVGHGETIGIVGRNGSGKSTLGRVISGHTPATSGSVYASSTPILLGVQAALVPELSGDQNIFLGCAAMGMSPTAIRNKFETVAELSGLGDAIYLPMKTYSAGMASRLQFAIATSVDPEILIIDEALNTGDAQFKDRSKQRMDSLRRNAGAVFLVSHSMETIVDMSTRALWMDKGQIVTDGSPRYVVNAYKYFTGYLAEGRSEAAAKIRGKARAKYAEVRISELASGRRRR